MAGSSFDTTQWTLVVAAGDSRHPGSQAALADLCQSYWYPLYERMVKLDVPALPDAQRYKSMLLEFGHADLAKADALSSQAIAITDKTLPQYTHQTDDWPQSNPIGYAA